MSARKHGYPTPKLKHLITHILFWIKLFSFLWLLYSFKLKPMNILFTLIHIKGRISKLMEMFKKKETFRLHPKNRGSLTTISLWGHLMWNTVTHVATVLRARDQGSCLWQQADWGGAINTKRLANYSHGISLKHFLCF